MDCPEASGHPNDRVGAPGGHGIREGDVLVLIVGEPQVDG